RTMKVATEGGARVVREAVRGYGAACLCGIANLAEACEVVVFLDADYSDHPDELPRLVAPVERGEADLVIGSRILGNAEPGALLPQARFGNRLACFLMRVLFRQRYTDLGPFRAVTRTGLSRMQMRDTNFGWTVEMQIKAAKQGIPHLEVPVSYRPRIGVSKISGTVKGSLSAGAKILWLLGRYAWS
ncbi:MAG: glycosyltransferase family 2 protein, partial [Deltaproteobacteria bacterium]|nr:glycosyltransferase family 2 protein [Deltaproteobacteria bacterium]